MEEDIKTADFKKFSRLVYEKSGITLTDKKRSLLQGRIKKLMRNKGIESFKHYFQLIEKDSSGKELIEFIDRISTNVTSFFREKAHFNYLRDIWIEEWRENNSQIPPNIRTINVWSAGCSKGAESYTIAIVLLESLNPNEYRNINISATDISTKMLKIAQKGIYKMDEVKVVSKSLLKKYFYKGSNSQKGYVKVKENIQSIVNFNYLNLMDSFDKIKEKYDIIFCRNTMIYFDNPTKEKLVYKFYNVLNDNGYLFTGHSESLSIINHDFIQKKPAVYRRIPS